MLLFGELEKHTEPKHKDYINIQRVLKLMKETASLLDNNKELAENLDKVLKIEKDLGLTHSLSRKWLKEGEIIYGKKKDLLTCWVFNDCVVLAKKKKHPLKNKFIYKMEVSIPLTEIDIIASGIFLVLISVVMNFRQGRLHFAL